MTRAQSILLGIIFQSLISTFFSALPVPSIHPNASFEEVAVLAKKEYDLHTLRERAISSKTYNNPSVESNILRLEAQVNQLRSQIWSSSQAKMEGGPCSNSDCRRNKTDSKSITLTEAKEHILHWLHDDETVSPIQRGQLSKKLYEILRISWLQDLRKKNHTGKSIPQPDPSESS